MKNTLTIIKKEDKYLILDISVSLINLFGLSFNNYPDIKNTELALPFLITHLKLLEISTVNYIEFLYNLKDEIYKIQIVKNENFTFTIFFENSNFKIKSNILEDSCLNNYEEFITNDKDLVDVINLKNKSPETINLEMIYLLKKIKEEIIELKASNEEQESKFIEKDAFSLFFILEKLGLKNLILFLFIISLFESIIIEPFLNPMVEKMYEYFEESIAPDS